MDNTHRNASLCTKIQAHFRTDLLQYHATPCKSVCHGHHGFEPLELIIFGVGIGGLVGLGIFFLFVLPALRETKDTNRDDSQ
jgi:hypothetical protein